LAIPYLSYQQVLAQTAEILEAHWSQRGIPVDIDHIVEIGFGIRITPLHGYRTRFGVEAAISQELDEIQVDNHCLTRQPRRYRFALAHELGHRALHGSIMRDLRITGEETWMMAIRAISSEDYGRMERQANLFAGLLLVPPRSLLESWRQAEARALESGIDNLGGLGPESLSQVAGSIANDFDVSSRVIQIRLETDELVEPQTR
jgi:Zn-dependent peptidase ImmA (M78 family)